MKKSMKMTLKALGVAALFSFAANGIVFAAPAAPVLSADDIAKQIATLRAEEDSLFNNAKAAQAKAHAGDHEDPAHVLADIEKDGDYGRRLVGLLHFADAHEHDDSISDDTKAEFSKLVTEEADRARRVNELLLHLAHEENFALMSKEEVHAEIEKISTCSNPEHHDEAAHHDAKDAKEAKAAEAKTPAEHAKKAKHSKKGHKKDAAKAVAPEAAAEEEPAETSAATKKGKKHHKKAKASKAPKAPKAAKHHGKKHHKKAAVEAAPAVEAVPAAAAAPAA